MSKREEILSQKYQALAAQLGDALTQKEAIEERISALKLEIKALNTAAPIIRSLDAAATPSPTPEVVEG
jgi:chromosome segregation ATPase